jgi:hypothetical protein
MNTNWNSKLQKRGKHFYAKGHELGQGTGEKLKH